MILMYVLTGATALLILVGGPLLARYWRLARLRELADARKIQKPGETEAIDVVWRRTFGCTDEPPVVRFADGAASFSSIRGNPVAGEANAEEIALAWPAGATWSTSAFAHELNHVRIIRAGGGSQTNHDDPSWGSGGLVERAVAALRARGL